MEYSSREICDRLEQALRLRFARDAYASGRCDYYDFRVEAASDDGSFLLTIVFKSGEKYCCFEPECHFGFRTRGDWECLRSELSAVGLEELGPLRIVKIHIIVEEGAEWGLRFPGDLRELQKSGGCSYEIGPYDESRPE